MHHIQLQRPEELRMMMREMSLRRVEQRFVRVACELRPALAVGDPTMTVRRSGQLAVAAALHLGLRPAEDVCISDPGFHGWHDLSSALSIRFQIVAGRNTS
jgi:hypothetical protein